MAQVYEFLQLLNKNASSAKGNKAAVLAFAGILNNEDTKEIKRIIKEEFNEIEGDWEL